MTREEAKEIFLNRGYIGGIYNGDKWREACIVISEWLEQEPIIDKIRADLYKLYNDRPSDYNHPQRTKLFWEVIKILDKYKGESEETNE